VHAAADLDTGRCGFHLEGVPEGVFGADSHSGGFIRRTANVTSLVSGYARVSRFGGDADEQRAALLALASAVDRVYLDGGLTGMTRPRPGLREALAAARGGDTVVVTALSRLAGSVPRRARAAQRTGRRCAHSGNRRRSLPASLPLTPVLVEVLARTAQVQTGLDIRRTRVDLAAARTRVQRRARAPSSSSTTDRNATSSGSTGQLATRSARSVSGSPSPAQPVNRGRASPRGCSQNEPTSPCI